MPIVTSPDRSRSHQALDPCLLGLPVHLLPQFANGLADALTAAMSSPARRRYWGGYRLQSLEFGRAPEPDQLRWLSVAGPHGTVAVAFERRLLLGLLEGRYGRRGGAAPPRDPATERVTATEERLSVVLTQHLAQVLAVRVRAGLEAVGMPLSPAQLTPAVSASVPGKTGWMLRAVLREPQSGNEGQCWMAPDQDMMTSILRGLMPDKGRASTVRASAEPLVSSLQVKLDGRLVSKEITLAALFDLQVGDVIPVSVGRVDVLLDESRLFTAAVAEHKGKLCLTSFEDAE